MSERITIPGLSGDDQASLDSLWEVLKGRAARNQMRQRRYDGKHAFRELGISTPPHLRHFGAVLGWPAKAVDMLADLCVPEGVVSPGVDLDALGVTEQWHRNDMQLQLMGAQRLSLISGVAWLVATLGGPGEPDVVWTVKDALNGTGSWRPGVRELDAFLSITDRDDDGHPTGLVLYRPGYTITATKDRGHWSYDRAEFALDRVPVEPVSYRPDPWRRYGRSRITREVCYLTDAAARTLVRSEVSAEFYSYPQRYALGVTEDDFTNPDGTKQDRWQAIMGTVWAIGRDDSGELPSVGQFPASTQQPHMDQLGVLAQTFAGATGIPVSSLGVGMQQSNPTSAEAYVTARQDLIGTARAAMRTWGSAYRRSMVTAVELLHGSVPAELWSASVDWDDPAKLPASTAADGLLKVTQALPWLADTEAAIDMLQLDEAQTAQLKADRRRARTATMLDALLQGDDDGN